MRYFDVDFSDALTFTFACTFGRHNTALDAFLHPLPGTVRPETVDPSLAISKLTLVGLFQSFLLLWINNTVIVRMSILLGNQSLSFNMIAVS